VYSEMHGEVKLEKLVCGLGESMATIFTQTLSNIVMLQSWNRSD